MDNSTLDSSSQPKKHSLIPNIEDFNGSIDDVDKSVHDYIWTKHRTLYVSTWIASITICLILFVLIFKYYDQTSGDGRVFMFPLVALMVPFGLYLHFRVQMQHLFMKQIAQALGFSYQSIGDPNTLEGKVFAAGHDKKMEDVISGSYQEYPIQICNYQTVIGSGRSSRTESYAVFALSLDAILPDILLVPGKTGSMLGTLNPLDNAPENDTKIYLEGNFSKYFTLYAPKDFEMEIRVIFQPDVMVMLIDKYQSYRIEIKNNKMYVLAPSMTKKQEFLTVHDLIDTLFIRVAPYLKEAGAKE